MTQRNTEARAKMLARRAASQRARVARFTPLPSKRQWPREHNVAFFTKRWTAARVADRDEWLKALSPPHAESRSE